MSYKNRNKRRRPAAKATNGASRNGRRPNRNGSGRKPSTLNPELFVKKAIPTEEVVYEAKRTIMDLPVHKELKIRLTRKGFERPSEIQDKTLESLMDGHDLLGIAQTGTGKTAAFLMPIINHLLQSRKRGEHALIVVPTRELALQVEEEFRSMTKGLKIFSECFIGGTNINKDMQALRRPSHVVIGTPGRLLDLRNRGALRFEKFDVLVLDEFDRMLDMGFAREMDRIINDMRDREQTMLFSATLDQTQERRIDEILTDPIQVKVTSGDTSAERVDQDVIRLQNGDDKFEVLFDLLLQDEFAKVLIFDETKHRVKKLSRKLNQHGIKCDEIQGNKSQTARQKALDSFKRGRVKVLVATDVAARGIDVNDITHVINYQAPRTYDSYIHRIGRTGRAGKTGKALTFVG